MKEMLLGFDLSLTKAETNRADSDIEYANSKNDANSKKLEYCTEENLEYLFTKHEWAIVPYR